MVLVSFHIEGAERASGTKILARTASDALFFVDHRNLDGLRIIRVGRYHLYSLGRAMAGTIIAGLTIPQRDAVLFYPDSMANPYRGLVDNRNGTDGPGRTNLRALHTLRPAISTLIRHRRLH